MSRDNARSEARGKGYRSKVPTLPRENRPPSVPVKMQGGGPPDYDRVRDLPRLLALWPWEIAAQGESSPYLLEKLRQALRAERQRGAAGHWTYDLVRHAQLLAAYRAEKRAQDSGRLKSHAGAEPPPGGTSEETRQKGEKK